MNTFKSNLQRFFASAKPVLIMVLFFALVILPASAQVYEKVFSFSGASGSGTFPMGVLLLASDGNYYGTTQRGGNSGVGTVYKLTSDGNLTTMVHFSGANGQYPAAGLVQGFDGNLYGTTQGDGSSTFGTVFKVTLSGVLTTLVTFNGSNGTSPQASLVQGSDGNFYGTTQGGGSSGGTVFKVTPSGVLTTLVTFNTTNGRQPFASLIQGIDGNFYGTTKLGGSNDMGTVFKMTPTGSLTTLVTFNGTNGKEPLASLIQGNDGNFYGTASGGGGLNGGTIFKVTPAGVSTTFDVTSGSLPTSALIQGSDSNFYGTTAGAAGTVFKFTPAGVLTTIFLFNGTNGSEPLAGLIQGSDGNFYGATRAGGSSGSGTVFKITPAGALTTLVNFVSTNGSFVLAGLLQGSDGNFFGTTQTGGSSGRGTIFKITPGGALATLVNFTDTNGSSPCSNLTLGSDGNLYGTTENGGGIDGASGTVFKVTSSGVLSTVLNFNYTNGGGPYAGVIQGSDGNFYGTTISGGSGTQGTVFKLSSSGALTTLVNFNSTNGAFPYGSVVQGSDGNFYGTTSAGGSSSQGTLFKVTPTGVLTTLVTFNTTNGGQPYASLILGSDNNFYGTTARGGSSDYGTIFKVTPSGVLTTLVSFTNTNGSRPVGALVLGSDGNFYGSTSEGGAGGNGTIFRMTPSGTLTTLYDYVNDPTDSSPRGPLIQASDGNYYGTTAGNSTAGGLGCVYRLVTSGKPNVYPNTPVSQNPTSAIVSFQANARGATTNITLSYGTDGVSFPNTIPISSNLTGYQTTVLGTTLSSLASGTTYYYRIVATNANGTTTSTVTSFSTLAQPTAVATPATNILPTSAKFNGTVNAFTYNTAVIFQYGTDGNTFPNTVAAVPGTVTGNIDVAVSANVAGLTSGQTYYYRISATNAGGTTVSGVSTFTTLTPPVETALPATLVTSQSAQLNGTANAVGASTAVTFEYGTDNVNFPYSVAGTPSPVTGSTTTNVSATISNSAGTPLVQGQTYYYRVRGTSAGGTSTSSSLPFSLDVLSGFARQFPNAPASAQGFVLVNLTPSGLNSGWRFAGEQLWRPGGVPAFGLVTGNYTIQYEPVPGYIQPAPETISVTSGGAATILNKEYYPASGTEVGGLDVVLQPASLADISVPAATRAQWRFYGENDSQWRNSGTTVSNLAPGNYLIECKPVSGQTTPAIASVAVSSGATALPTLTYFVSGNPTGAQPALLPFSTVINSATPAQPYAFVGQIRSDVGTSTGFVVKSRVVATACHVVFDDGVLTYVTGLQWLFERYAGTYEPVPQVPTGFYVFDGYATQRTAEHTPGVSSPASQNLDVAAMYFLTNAGNGGYSGYLGSDANTNEFLVSSRSKMLVGYPVDGIALANDGQMFATSPITATFAQVNGTDTSGDAATGGKPYRVYTTIGLSSVGGNSGGPLCVQFDDGNYYPAAIYLGGSAQTVVRSIDSPVIDLFNRADVSGNGGGNNTGGGITQVNTSISGGQQSFAAIQVTLLPSTAASTATWKLGSTAVGQFSGATLLNLPVQTYQLYLSTVPGFLAPPLLLSSPVTPKPNFAISTTGGVLSNITYTYEGITGQPQNVNANPGGNATFSVSVSGTPTSYQWQRNSTDIAGATSASYTRSNLTAADTGTYNVVVTWGTDGSQTSTPAALNVGTSTQVSFAQWQTTYSQTGGANATPQHDGVPNLLKYLYDINPTRAMSTADKAALPVVALTPVTGTSYLTLTYRQYANMTGVTVNVQTSTDLSTWSPVTSPNLLSQQVGTDTSTGDPMMQVGVKATSSTRYIRLNVTNP